MELPRTLLRLSLAAALVGAVAAGCGDDNPSPTANSSPNPVSTSGVMELTVNIPAGATGRGTSAYSPNPANIATGGTVTWVNQDSVPHTVTSTTGAFDSGTIMPGMSWSHRFDTAGTWDYFCEIHGAASMSGTVVVSGAGTTSTPSPSPSPAPSPTPSPSMTMSPSPTPSPTGGMTMSVSIPMGATGRGAAAYGTNPLVVSPGTTVRWTNNDSMPHTVTSSSGLFDSGTMQPGQTFSRTFTQAGDYPYFCEIHGAGSMSGMVRISP